MILIECKCNDHYIPYLASDECDVINHMFMMLKEASKQGVEVGTIDWIRVSQVGDVFEYLDSDELNDKLEKWREKARRNNEERSENSD